MGHLQSKEECFYLSPDLHQALDDKLWKQKTGFNLANYNMDESLSELSICLEERTESSPLRVQLPPRRSETETSKLLTLDHEDTGNHDNEGSHDKSKIKIEEFECGVHFECSENAKQEWAFTLYDFDGHGKITKEDLASLLKALYDAVGSSIKLPPNGAKTLKLRLTVGQETMSHVQNPNIKSAEHSRATNKTPRHKEREFSKMNNLTRGHVKRNNECQGQRVLSQTTPTTNQATMNQATTATMNQATTANMNQATTATMNQAATATMNQATTATMNQATTATMNQAATANINQAGKKEVSTKPGVMNHQPEKEHQRLIDTVQENLAPNQGRQFRKHQNETRNLVHNRHKRPHRASGLHCPTTSALHCPTTSAPTEQTTSSPTGTRKHLAETTINNAPKESKDRRDYYLDLAGVECNSSKVLNNVCLPSCGRMLGKNKHRSDDVSFGATNEIFPGHDKCDVTSHLSQEQSAVSFLFPQLSCDIPSCSLQEKCISSRLTHEKCVVTSCLTHEKRDICGRLNREKCSISSRLSQEKGDISSRLTQEKGDISSPLNQEKCSVTSRLAQEESDVLSPLRREKCDVFSLLAQEKCSISSRLSQGKCGISLSTLHEKCDPSFQIADEKCDTASCKLKENGDIFSRLAHEKCDISSRPFKGKGDIYPRLLQEKSDISSRLTQIKGDICSRISQEKGDSFSRPSQGKRDEALRLTPATCDTSSRFLRDKCNVDSRSQDKSTPPSRLQQTINDYPSQLPLGKYDNLVRQEGELGASKKSQGLPSKLNLRSKSLDVPEIPKSTKPTKSKKPKGWLNFSGGRFRPVSLPGQESITVLPDCHRRQRHREKDRDVMMQQVAEWIEREHVDSVVVQRHEHHHIHEHHHHHHFHHHHET
ncbi:unnamed protein product [Candidula unifasciata]|uniref:Protein naked cuticle homolog n=1 Tax=Candidula unifasciata TaxID=100452 RepID=A0A8S3Z8K1_9EUPU|nr:unnamed protein product [Candidula unifasciata]